MTGPPPLPQMLEYAHGMNRRPGLITAIGVISIVLGSLAVLYNGAVVTQLAFRYQYTRRYQAAALTGFRGSSVTGRPLSLPPSYYFRLMEAGVEGLLFGGLAVYLLVAGIRTLRSSRRGAVLHRIYSWIKVALVVLSAAAAGRTMYLRYRAYPGSTGYMSSFFWNQLMITLVGAALSLAYPVILLVVLHTRRIRDYYQQAGAG